MKYSGEGNVINDGRFNRDPVILVGSDDQLLIFHSCLIYSEFQLLKFWTVSERVPKGNFELMLLQTTLKTIFRFVYLKALFRIFDHFTKWVLKQFFPFSTANISTLVSLSCTGTLKILTKCSFETHTCIFILRCLAHDKAQIYRIFSYGAHSILSDQVATLKF